MKVWCDQQKLSRFFPPSQLLACLLVSGLDGCISLCRTRRYSARFARKIIRDADDDGNGVIDADEFTAHMSKLNISSDAATCEARFVVVLMTSIHDNTRRAAESARRLMGEDVVDETPAVSFVQQLVNAGYGAPPDTIHDGVQGAGTATQLDTMMSDDATTHSSSNQKESPRSPSVATTTATRTHQREGASKAQRNNLKTTTTKKQKGKKLKDSRPPYLQCSFMCFCGHTKHKQPREPDPEPLFDHEFFKPRHLRRPFVNVAPPKMAPMPAPGPQVLPTLNVFDNDFMAHLNKSPCVIVFVSSALLSSCLTSCFFQSSSSSSSSSFSSCAWSMLDAVLSQSYS